MDCPSGQLGRASAYDAQTPGVLFVAARVAGLEVQRMIRRYLAALALLVSLCVPAAAHAAQPDIARYVLPPGNYGGLPTGPHSLDQLPLYSGLTPLRRNVSMSDVFSHYL